MKKEFIKLTHILYAITTSLVILTCTSCISQPGIKYDFTYSSTLPNNVVVNKSYDDCWNKVITYFAENNIGIRIIDKNSGLIISNTAYFPAEYVTVNIPRKTTYVAVQYYSGYRLDGTGMKSQTEWNVRLLKIDDNNTKITINTFPKVNCYLATSYNGYGTPLSHAWLEITDLKCVSTGNFEELLFNYIKK